MHPRLIQTALETNSLRYPDKIALVQGNNQLSYFTLNDFASRLARTFLNFGAVPGDRIVLLLENSMDFVISLFAILKAGCIAVPLVPDEPPHQIQAHLIKLAPSIIITSPQVYRALPCTDFSLLTVSQIILTHAPPQTHIGDTSLHVLSDILLQRSDYVTVSTDTHEQSAAIILYPNDKHHSDNGILLDHNAMTTIVSAVAHYLHLSHRDIQMQMVPFYHPLGMTALTAHIASCGTILINDTIDYPISVIQQMLYERVTGLTGTSDNITSLLHNIPDRLLRDKLGDLRYCLLERTTGNRTAPLCNSTFPEQTRLCRLYRPPCAALPITCGDQDKQQGDTGIGIPLLGVSLKILDELGAEVEQGTIGELVVNGTTIMKGYWNNPRETAQVLTQHGYHIGSTGYQGVDGSYHLTPKPL